MGLRPSELSPPDEPVALPVDHCPLGVTFLPPASPRNVAGAGAHRTGLGSVLGETWRPPSGSCSRRELVQGHVDFTRRGLPMLSWTFASLGSPLPRRWDDLRRPSSHALRPRPSRVAPVRAQGCAAECRSTVVVASSLSRVPSPPEVSCLLFSHRFGVALVLGYPSGRCERHRSPRQIGRAHV